MTEQERKNLEAAGWRSGTAKDFLELTEEEWRIIDLRLDLADAIRGRREALGMTQAELAKLIGSSPSCVAKIEVAARGVSLDLMARALVKLGGTLSATAAKAAARSEKPAAPKAAPAKRGRARKKAGTPAKV